VKPGRFPHFRASNAIFDAQDHGFVGFVSFAVPLETSRDERMTATAQARGLHISDIPKS